MSEGSEVRDYYDDGRGGAEEVGGFELFGF